MAANKLFLKRRAVFLARQIIADDHRYLRNLIRNCSTRAMLR